MEESRELFKIVRMGLSFRGDEAYNSGLILSIVLAVFVVASYGQSSPSKPLSEGAEEALASLPQEERENLAELREAISVLSKEDKEKVRQVIVAMKALAQTGRQVPAGTTIALLQQIISLLINGPVYVFQLVARLSISVVALPLVFILEILGL
ncbi:unnamed protein product [Cyprideis torosa]|uniref:Uncharacterized protein n=1 Tax=Cyprideis torosa TaxID=163714 RepID=A0A7R8ZP33_9CRUS|nr:unnamed protein product [Cyprideis torosa]CAG0892970.1 unnamed protein product [Cyprideis torosa]